MKKLALATFLFLPFLATAQSDKPEGPVECMLNFKLTRTDKSGVVLSESITTVVKETDGTTDSTMSLNMATNESPHFWIFRFELSPRLDFYVSDPKQLTSGVTNGNSFVNEVEIFKGAAIRNSLETYTVCCLDGETVKLTILASAEPKGADQPATKPADKPPVKDQPSTSTPKDGPR